MSEYIIQLMEFYVDMFRTK